MGPPTPDTGSNLQCVVQSTGSISALPALYEPIGLARTLTKYDLASFPASLDHCETSNPPWNTMAPRNLAYIPAPDAHPYPFGSTYISPPFAPTLPRQFGHVVSDQEPTPILIPNSEDAIGGSRPSISDFFRPEAKEAQYSTPLQGREDSDCIPGNTHEDFGTYRQMLREVERRYIQDTRFMLGVILCALGPLTLMEFRFVVAFGSENSCESQSSMQASKAIMHSDIEAKRMVYNRCGGLIKVTQGGGDSTGAPLKFVHPSVKDFLQDEYCLNMLELDIGESLIIRGNKCLLRSCIRYLTISELSVVPASLQKGHAMFLEEEIEDAFTDFLFLGYAARYWMDHWAMMEHLGAPQSLQVQELEQSPNSNRLQTWA